MRKEDCEAIAKLLDSGFSIKDALIVLKEKENEKAFDEIMNRLNDGESLHAFFYLYCPKSYVVLFESMSQCMPFLDSLLTCIEMHRAIEKSQKQIIDGMLYPSLLFLGMIVGMYLFNALILPNMITLLMGFQVETDHLLVMHEAIQSMGNCIAFSNCYDCFRKETYCQYILLCRKNISRQYSCTFCVCNVCTLFPGMFKKKCLYTKYITYIISSKTAAMCFLYRKRNR